jgi:hypothetical protein
MVRLSGHCCPCVRRPARPALPRSKTSLRVHGVPDSWAQARPWPEPAPKVQTLCDSVERSAHLSTHSSCHNIKIAPMAVLWAGRWDTRRHAARPPPWLPPLGHCVPAAAAKLRPAAQPRTVPLLPPHAHRLVDASTSGSRLPWGGTSPIPGTHEANRQTGDALEPQPPARPRAPPARAEGVVYACIRPGGALGAARARPGQLRQGGGAWQAPRPEKLGDWDGGCGWACHAAQTEFVVSHSTNAFGGAGWGDDVAEPGTARTHASEETEV